MSSDNPLGIMYFAYDSAGRPGLGFAAFENQSPVSSHNSEWSEILSEIIGKGQSPVMLRACSQSDFLDAVKSVPA
jgi:hypothetical protein